MGWTCNYCYVFSICVYDFTHPKLRLEHERNLALGKIADAINGEGRQNVSNRRRRRNMILGINTKEAVENFIKEQLQNKDISPEMVAAIAELMKAASTL